MLKEFLTSTRSIWHGDLLLLMSAKLHRLGGSLLPFSYFLGRQPWCIWTRDAAGLLCLLYTCIPTSRPEVASCQWAHIMATGGGEFSCHCCIFSCYALHITNIDGRWHPASLVPSDLSVMDVFAKLTESALCEWKYTLCRFSDKARVADSAVSCIYSTNLVTLFYVKVCCVGVRGASPVWSMLLRLHLAAVLLLLSPPPSLSIWVALYYYYYYCHHRDNHSHHPNHYHHHLHHYAPQIKNNKYW